jgi:hypothetical protein
VSYIDFKSLVKKVNLKPNGKKEIVLEVSDRGLDGKLDVLSEMIDCKVAISLESQVVNYNVTFNAQTNRPVTEYKVDDKGVVSEVEREEPQIEADLGLPPENIPIEEKSKQADVEVIDRFIVEGMSPNFDDLPYDFANIVKRKIEGETYLKLANELDMSSGKLVEYVDDYRKRVAPQAQAWWEWKENKQEEAAAIKDTDSESDEE